MVCPAINNPASCEICVVIRFLHAKCMSAAEIRRELCAVYGQNIMSEGTVRQRCRMFKDGRRNVHNEERSVQPSVVCEDLAQSVDKKNMKDDASQFENFHVNLHKFHAPFSTRLSQLG
jgi:hypothetical protein